MASTLRDFVQSRGKNFVMYDEAAKVRDSVLDQGAVQEQFDLCKALSLLQRNLCFNDSTLTAACEEVIADFAGK